MKISVLKFEKLKNPEIWVLLFSAFCVGAFNEPVCAFIGIVLSVLLVLRIAKEKVFNLYLNIGLAAICAVCAGFLLTAIWGVDRYYSLLGFVKFAPLFLLYIYATQKSEEENYNLLEIIPLAGAVMTVVSAVFSLFKGTANLFSVNSRISGFFQYPSTFALFLIIGLIVLSKDKLTKLNALIGAILMAGVFLSGSRSSFVVLLICVVGIIFTAENKAFRRYTLIAIVAILAVALIYYFVAGDSAFTRFLKISLSSVTLRGRLLYFKDALRQIVRHPFGLGYLGYYFSQGSFQTGVYSNRFVHNEVLQLLLDIGWVPALLCAGWFAKSLFSKEKPKYIKLIASSILIHSLMDFDMQYLAIDFILIICLFDASKVRKINVNNAGFTAICIVLGAVAVMSGLLGSSSLMYLIHKPESAVKICKHNTLAQIEILDSTGDVEKANEIAQTVLENDKYIPSAYSAQAQYYLNDGDVENAVKCKQQALSYGRYLHDDYEDLLLLLAGVTGQYIEAGDYESAQYCVDKMTEVQNSLKKVEKSTDKLAYDLNDKPDFTISKECREAIEYYAEMFAE